MPKSLVYSSTAFKNVKEGAVLGAKERRARDKGLFRRQSGRGHLWGDLDACFVTMSLSISMKRKVIACSGGCEALVDTRTSLTLAQEDCSITYRSSTLWGSKVKKAHAPGSLPVSTHKKDLQGQPLSFSLSNSTTFHVFPSIPCPLLSSPSMVSVTQSQLKPTCSR